MQKLLIATTNPGKLADLKKFLSDMLLNLVSLSGLNIFETVEETGKTFAKNAIIKATFYQKLSGLPTLADDGGFEIDALGGEPGVRSHRWPDPQREADDEELITYTMKRMEGIPLKERSAQLRLALALALPNGKVFTAEEKVRGIIPIQPAIHRTKGYPYRSLLFLPEINKFYDHSKLTEQEIKDYDHRRRAVEKLKPIIKKQLLML